MLGGSFWVAILRNGMSITLMLSFFLMLDRPRFSMKKTICCYAVFGLFLLFGFSVWYLLDYESFVKIAPLTSFPVIGIFCSLMSGEIIYILIQDGSNILFVFCRHIPRGGCGALVVSR